MKIRDMKRDAVSVSARIVAAAALALSAQVAIGQTFNAGIPSGWTTTGSAGTLGSDGVVTLAPGGGGAYGWVSTDSGVTGVSPFSLGDETNGSVLRSTSFAAGVGDALDFKFNYVTSDGQTVGGTYVYQDYGWARVLNASNLSQVALLFTARTEPSGSIIPGAGMALPEATLTPTQVPIVGGGPSWSALGSDSGACYGPGCGYTGWVDSHYAFAQAGNFILEFGVVNWADTAFQSGMAFDGITVAGNPIAPIPEPSTYAMLLAGLGMMGFMARRRHRKQTA